MKSSLATLLSAIVTVSSLSVLVSLPESGYSPAAEVSSTATTRQVGTDKANQPANALESEVSSDLYSCYKDTSQMDASCFEQVLLDAIRTVGTQAAMSGFNEHLERYPQSAPWCHSAAHAAGDLAFSLNQDESLTEILSHGGTSCIMGYVHGVLEGFASSVKDSSRVKEAIQACSAAFGDTAQTGTCYDGVGHAAWMASKNIDAAVDVCASMPSDAHRQTCEMGIIMQIFEPAHEKPTLDMGPNRVKAAEFCNSWPSSIPTKEADPKTGCWRGASYLFGKGLTDKWFASDRKPVSENLEKWKREVLEAFKPCGVLGDVGEAVCYAEAGSYLIGDWQEHNVSLAKELCMSLPVSGPACVKQVESVAANYGWS